MGGNGLVSMGESPGQMMSRECFLKSIAGASFGQTNWSLRGANLAITLRSVDLSLQVYLHHGPVWFISFADMYCNKVADPAVFAWSAWVPRTPRKTREGVFTSFMIWVVILLFVLVYVFFSLAQKQAPLPLIEESGYLRECGLPEYCHHQQ